MREIRENKSQAAREEEDALAAAELAYEQALLGYQVTPFEDSLHGYIECDAALQRTRKRFVGFPPRPSEGIAEQLPRKLASIQNDFYTLRRPEFVQSMKMLQVTQDVLLRKRTRPANSCQHVSSLQKLTSTWQICDVTELGSPGAEQADENQIDDCNEPKPRQCRCVLVQTIRIQPPLNSCGSACVLGHVQLYYSTHETSGARTLDWRAKY